MKSPLEAAACAVNVGILRAASLFVPARQRMEWRSEWRGELWQARSQTSSRFSWAQEREIAGFCLGAFSDAFCLRRIDRHIYAAQTPRTVSYTHLDVYKRQALKWSVGPQAYPRPLMAGLG